MLRLMVGNVKYIGLIICVGCVLSLPLIVYGFPFYSSDTQHAIWYSNFSSQLWNGEFYPRWLADMNGGFGSPTFLLCTCSLLPHGAFKTLFCPGHARLASARRFHFHSAGGFGCLRLSLVEENSPAKSGVCCGDHLHGDAIPPCH